MSVRITPDLAAFEAMAPHHRVIGVHTRLRADNLTAVGLYHQLCGTRPGTFLLESAEDGVFSRYSFVGVNAAATLSEVGGEATWSWSGRAIAGLPRTARSRARMPIGPAQLLAVRRT